MKTYRTENKTDRIGFVNFERRGEKEIFNEAIHKISLISDVTLGTREELPYIDVARGKLGQTPFAVMLDLDYGAEVYCNDPDTLKIIESKLNEN